MFKKLVILVASVTLFSSAACYASLFAAIAYSEKTGFYGKAKNSDKEEEATAAAISNCARSDCKIVALVKNGYVAFSLGDEFKFGTAIGYYEDGENDETVQEKATTNCSSKTSNCKPIVCLYSSDNDPIWP